jgi:hypothetical protein
MIRLSLHFACLVCVLALTLAGCKKSDSSTSSTGTGGSAALPGTTGGHAGGTVAASAGTTGATGTAGSTGSAGAGAAAGMTTAQCLAGGNHMNPACQSCSCMPDAMNGCLDELSKCQGASDAMSATLCGAIIDCATMNKCTGTACVTPCMTQITAAAGYMGGAPLTAATAVGTCSMMKCGTVCP